jgi:hypothetical protein
MPWRVGVAVWPHLRCACDEKCNFYSFVLVFWPVLLGREQMFCDRSLVCPWIGSPLLPRFSHGRMTDLRGAPRRAPGGGQSVRYPTLVQGGASRLPPSVAPSVMAAYLPRQDPNSNTFPLSVQIVICLLSVAAFLVAVLLAGGLIKVNVSGSDCQNLGFTKRAFVYIYWITLCGICIQLLLASKPVLAKSPSLYFSFLSIQ